MRKSFFLGIISGLGLLVLFFAQQPDANLHLVFCPVGQGDGILVSQGTSQVLIDGGPDEKILSCLAKKMPFWDRKIELVILTHPEKDHFGGLIEVLKRYKVEKMLLNSFGKETAEFMNLAQVINDQKIYTIFPTPGMKIRLGKIFFDLFWPSRSALKELEEEEKKGEKLKNFFLIKEELVKANKYSLVFQLKLDQFASLFLADLPGEISQQLIWRRELPSVAVVKASHHGAGGDNPLMIYQKIRPSVVVISVGRNSFGHPSEEFIQDLKKLGIKVLRTDQGGMIEIVSDGKKFWLGGWL